MPLIAELEQRHWPRPRQLEGLTDDGLLHLALMPQLRFLNLSGAKITDRGLEVLRHLPNLRVLEMGGSARSATRVSPTCGSAITSSASISWARHWRRRHRSVAGEDSAVLVQQRRLVTDAGLRLLQNFRD